MRIVHTFWGLPMKDVEEHHRLHVLMYALSALYAKRNKDVQMVLYVDTIGKEILKPALHIYDEVHTVTIPNSIKPLFFAAIKAVALKREPVGAVHIDGDVMLKTADCYARLENLMQRCDVVTQGIEPNDNPYDEVEYFEKHGINMGCNIKHRSPCNVGVLGFSNKALRDAYLRNYFKYATMLSNRKDINEIYIPDIVLEQAWLSAYTKKAGYLMGEMVPGLDWDAIQTNAKKYGYCHLWSNSKYKSMALIEQRLRENFPEEYERLIAELGTHYETEYIGIL